MQRPSRKRTTLTPGVVDLPRARRTSAEVALEKQKKDSAATKKAEAKRQAEIRVAELEKQVAVAQNEARNASKRPRKQPAMIVERDAPAASSSSGPTAGKKRKADEQPTAMVIKKKGRPRSSVPAKPKGFNNHLVHAPPIPEPPPNDEPEVITDGGEDDESEGDSEDELEFSDRNNSSASLVSIIASSTSSTSNGAPDHRQPRPGVNSLPEAIRNNFADMLVPCVTARVGCSSTPWSRVKVEVLQRLFGLVYPTHDLQIKKGDTLETAIHSRMMIFRNAVGRRAIQNVQAYVNRFDIHKTEEYVASAFSYHGEIPFLYRVFRPTQEVEPDLDKEPGGFKVIRHGLFRHPAILETMLTYYQFIKSDVETASLTGIHPVGALALVCTAVARAFQMHQTGVFILNSTPFSGGSDSGKNTTVYLNLIGKMTESRWTSFYSAVKITAELVDELRGYSKADGETPLQDKPEAYHIRDSDPIDPNVHVDLYNSE